MPDPLEGEPTDDHVSPAELSNFRQKLINAFFDDAHTALQLKINARPELTEVFSDPEVLRYAEEGARAQVETGNFEVADSLIATFLGGGEFIAREVYKTALEQSLQHDDFNREIIAAIMQRHPELADTSGVYDAAKQSLQTALREYAATTYSEMVEFFRTIPGLAPALEAPEVIDAAIVRYLEDRSGKKEEETQQLTASYLAARVPEEVLNASFEAVQRKSKSGETLADWEREIVVVRGELKIPMTSINRYIEGMRANRNPTPEEKNERLANWSGNMVIRLDRLKDRPDGAKILASTEVQQTLSDTCLELQRHDLRDEAARLAQFTNEYFRTMISKRQNEPKTTVEAEDQLGVLLWGVEVDKAVALKKVSLRGEWAILQSDKILDAAEKAITRIFNEDYYRAERDEIKQTELAGQVQKEFLPNFSWYSEGIKKFLGKIFAARLTNAGQVPGWEAKNKVKGIIVLKSRLLDDLEASEIWRTEETVPRIRELFLSQLKESWPAIKDLIEFRDALLVDDNDFLGSPEAVGLIRKHIRTLLELSRPDEAQAFYGQILNQEGSVFGDPEYQELGPVVFIRSLSNGGVNAALDFRNRLEEAGVAIGVDESRIKAAARAGFNHALFDQKEARLLKAADPESQSEEYEAVTDCESARLILDRFLPEEKEAILADSATVGRATRAVQTALEWGDTQTARAIMDLVPSLPRDLLEQNEREEK